MTSQLVLLAAVPVAAVAVLAVIRPRVALLLLVVCDVSNLNGVLAEQVGISPYRPQLAVAVLALLVLLVKSRRQLTWSPVLLGVGVLFAGFGISLIGAVDPVGSQGMMGSRGRDLIYFLVVYALVLTTRSVREVAAATVLVLSALAGLTVVHEFVLDNRGDLFGLSRVPLVQESGASTARHAGTSADVNFWARLLILFTPPALSLAASATRRSERLVLTGGAVSLFCGVYLSQSRGGFIALFVAVVAWLALAGGWYRRSLLAMPVVVAVLLPLSGIGRRLATLAAASGSADPSLVERKRLQVGALRMFLDAPITGHGIGSYPVIFERYDRLADGYQPVTIRLAAHNLYLEQAADGGLVLLMAWSVFVGTMLFATLRALLVARRAGTPGPAWLAIGVMTGLLGWLLASAFLHLSDFRALLLVAALSAAIDVAVRELTPRPAPARSAARAPGRLAVTGLAVLAVLGAAGLGASLATGHSTYRASATLAVVPATAAASGSTAYQLDVVSRGIIVPSLAAILEATVTTAEAERRTGRANTGADVTIAPSDQGGALLVRVSSTDRANTALLSGAAVVLASREVADLKTGYQLSGSVGAIEEVPPRRRWLAVPAAVAVLAAGLGLLRIRRRRPAILDSLGVAT